MKLTPALPNPYQLPAQARAEQAVARAPDAPREAVEETRRRSTPKASATQAQRERLAARAETNTVLRQEGQTGRASRALSAYEEVARSGEKGELRALLGFDAFA